MAESIMSNATQPITNESVIPRIETDLFADHPEARFAVGMLATGNEVLPGLEREHQGYLRLRANVYAEQAGFIPKDHVNPDGTETDANDVRSVHFGIIENVEQGDGRVVASMRLIIKSMQDARKLPIEDFFPEVFDVNPVALNSTEVSRYICRHEEPRIAGNLTWPLFFNSASYILSHDIRPTFGVIETFLEHRLQKRLVPIERVTDLKHIPEYASENIGISIDTDKLGELIELVSPGTLQEIAQNERSMRYLTVEDVAPSNKGSNRAA